MRATLRHGSEKLRKIRGKIKNVGAPTFLGRGHPPVFAYAGERKELPAEILYAGETRDLAKILEENAKEEAGKEVPGMVRTR
jgi:hypothetical protein